jgi:hypothetical protein
MRSATSNRGAVLIVALVFGAILSISLASYLKLSLNAGKLANRSFYLNAAQNVVDTGLEHALWSLNNEHVYSSPTNWTTGGFVARTGFSNEYQGEFPSSSTFYHFAGGARGQVKVWAGVTNPAATPANYIWKAVAEATITLGDGTTLVKMAEAYLKQRSHSERGMVAREGITFNGNVAIDSWKSRGEPYNLSNDIPYNTVNRRPEATVATPALIAIQNADVYGYVAIGSSTIDSTGLTVGAQGRVRGAFTGAGSGPGVDPARVTCNFTANFPDVFPAASGAAIAPITANTTLSTGTYSVASIVLSASGDDIHIGASGAADVTLTVTGSVSMAGGSAIFIYPGSSLRMYVAGDISMTGTSGVQNGTATAPNNPDCFTLLGLRTEAQIASGFLMQDWKVRGTSYLSCVIFAPNANIEVNGTGDTYGSVVGNRVDMVGSGNFHQDESLGNYRISGLWKLLKWRELYTAPDRAAYASQMSF